MFQRFDYSVLTPFLPPKQEYVISVKLSEVQIKAYQYYLENFSASQGQELDGVLKPKGAKLFSDFQTLQRIWTHPRVMLMNAEKNEKLAERKVFKINCFVLSFIIRTIPFYIQIYVSIPCWNGRVFKN